MTRDTRSDDEFRCGRCKKVRDTTQRRFDRFNIYFGRRCDPCWEIDDPADYQPEEAIDAEPDCAGGERDW